MQCETQCTAPVYHVQVSLRAIRKTCTGLFGSCIAGVTNPVSLLAYLKESINCIPSLLAGENLKKTRQHDR